MLSAFAVTIVLVKILARTDPTQTGLHGISTSAPVSFALMGLVAELPPKLARAPAGRSDFGPRMGVL